MIDTVSEDTIEVVNATSTNVPYSVSEWKVSQLTEAANSTVMAPRAEEGVFSIEINIKEFDDHKKEILSIAANALIKATRFGVREDAKNEAMSHIGIEKRWPIGQLGDMAYGRVSGIFEMPRREWKVNIKHSDFLKR